MRLISIGGLSKARLWQGELPDLACDPDDTSAFVVPGATRQAVEARRVAVEIYLPRGPMNQYGLLGATFTPMPGDYLEATIRTCPDCGARVDWSLAQNADEVSAGIPSWAVTPITAAVQAAEVGRELGAGTLNFSCGASGAVGSSPQLFGRLARAVLGLLILPERVPSDEAVLTILRASFS